MRSTTKEVGTQTDATPINFEARAAQAMDRDPDAWMQPEQAQATARACVICLDADPDTALIPCGHLQTCYACAAAVHRCPICRKRIETRLKIFQD